MDFLRFNLQKKDMRYSAIGVFNDGSFYPSSVWKWTVHFHKPLTNANIMRDGLYNSSHSTELQEFFEENKYVIVKIKGYNFMIFEESHPMFNTVLLRNEEGINIEGRSYKYDQKINYQQEIRLLINRLIVEFGGLNSSLLE